MDRNRSRTLLLSTACVLGAAAAVAGCTASTDTVSSTGTTGATSDGATTRSAPSSAGSGSTAPATPVPSGALDWSASSVLLPEMPQQSPASIPETTITITDPNQPPPQVTEPPTIPATGEDPVLIDCGIVYRASGWPTTFALSSSYFDCIGDAFASGTPARLIDREQTDGFGGAILITTYDVLGPGRIRVTVDARAAADRPQVVTVSNCTGLSIESYQIEVAGCTDAGS